MAKKKSAARASAQRAAKRELLAKELRKLIPQIDEEGLAFLIKQSHTIIYNMRVDEMNKALARVDRMEKRATGTVNQEEAAKETRSEASSATRSVSRSEREARSFERASSGTYGVWVEEAPGGKSFIIVLGAMRKAFSRVELRKLIAVAKSGSDDAARSEQLYAWFQKHRSDVLFDGRIGSRRHPLLAQLARYLRTHYSIRT